MVPSFLLLSVTVSQRIHFFFIFSNKRTFSENYVLQAGNLSFVTVKDGIWTFTHVKLRNHDFFQLHLKCMYTNVKQNFMNGSTLLACLNLIFGLNCGLRPKASTSREFNAW